MLDNILKNWNFVRLLRLAMGVFLTVEAIKSGMWLLVAVGVVFVVMPLFNVGCCANGSCNVPTSRSNNNSDEVDYEEIK